MLTSRQDWYKDFTMEPWTSSEINLTLDLAAIHETLQDMNFYELKGFTLKDFLLILNSAENFPNTLSYSSWLDHGPNGREQFSVARLVCISLVTTKFSKTFFQSV